GKARCVRATRDVGRVIDSDVAARAAGRHLRFECSDPDRAGIDRTARLQDVDAAAARGPAEDAVRARSSQRGEPADNIDIAVDRVGGNPVRDTADITVVDDIGGAAGAVAVEGGVDGDASVGTSAGGWTGNISCV